ncbi:MAG: thioredoxin family protein [Bacteroidales bacterium]|nr:thioredoxin family protein [Bacteroidales bacterium]MBO7488507.1 thioredoxin family protein [Bacteroidales bacterium]
MMKKTILLLCCLFLGCISLAGQSVVWSATSSEVKDGLYSIEVTAVIPSGWHIYDLEDYEGGPNPTTLTFTLPKGAEFAGEMTVSKEPVKYHDEIFGMEIGYWDGVVTFTRQVAYKGKAVRGTIDLEWMMCNDTSCSPPQDEQLKFTLGSGNAATVSSAAPLSSQAPRGLWALIIEAILWGFAALLTPCVFPMVPMTVSFFLKGSDNKARGKFRALMYGLFIVALYTVPIAAIIVITRLVGGDAVTADIFNWLATHWLPNILFFIVFMVFAASFFGAFEIVLPSKLVNRSDAESEKRQGLGGVFFLALTLVLVSFSCTGPIVGSVLIKSTSGEFWTPILTMFAFSLAFALPFALLALFPSLLQKLPKSGGWLNSVKVVLGFIEIALGLKFLSVADQVYHWGLLDREVYLAIWIVCFTLLGLYLLGKLKFKYDSDLKYISVGRLALAIIDLAFVVYMIPGMWGAPLKALSGYLPPLQTQDFVLDRYAPAASESQQSTYQGGIRKYSDFLTLPLDLDGYFDLEEAKAAAAESGKPIFLDFTGHGCVNCREMEARVWSDERVYDHLRNDFIICALYTDDKKVVAESDWVITPAGKVLKTLGKINAHYALSEFGVNAQPYYVLMTPDGEPISERGYDLSAARFAEWLETAL